MRSKIALLFFSWTLAGCSDLATENANTRLVFTLGETNSAYHANLHNDHPIIINTEIISDYRCPEGAQCIYRGGYTADLLIRQGGQSVRIKLCNGECEGGMREKDTESFLLNGRLYSITLIELTPVPTLFNQEDEKNIVLALK